MGCAHCLDDVASLVCLDCHDWANDISERVHGKMVKDKQLIDEAFRLTQMLVKKKINLDDFKRLWAEAKLLPF